MKNTNLLLLLLLVLLGGIAAWFWSKNQVDTTPAWDRQFAVEDKNDIHKIFIAHRSGETYTLLKEDTRWVVNGKHTVRPSIVDIMLKTLSTLRLKYIPPTGAVEPIIKDLATQGLKVEIYDKRNKKLKSYYVGGSPHDEYGTYMLMENSNQPYVMTVPGFEGNLRERYDLQGDEWRDINLFDLTDKDIREVHIDYPAARAKSFVLKRDGNDFVVKPYYPTITPTTAPVQKAAAEAYLRNFKNIKGDSFSNDYLGRDSIALIKPYNVTTVVTNQQDTFKTIFVVRGTDRLIASYWAWNKQGDLMTAQQQVIEKMFWEYDAFFKTPTAK